MTLEATPLVFAAKVTAPVWLMSPFDWNRKLPPLDWIAIAPVEAMPGLPMLATL